MLHEVDTECRLLSALQASKYLDITGRTLSNLVARGGTRPVKLTGVRRTFFAREDVEAGKK